jgi:hypothetical protein
VADPVFGHAERTSINAFFAYAATAATFAFSTSATQSVMTSCTLAQRVIGEMRRLNGSTNEMIVARRIADRFASQNDFRHHATFDSS